MGMTARGGVWNGYWENDPSFWMPNSQRFPHGLSGLSDYAHHAGVRLGLWFAPDSYHDFVNWRRDAERLLSWSNEDHIDAFKLDSVKIQSKKGEANYHALADRVLKQSSGRVLLDLDVTAETRQGYFGNIAAGPLFVENRYTDVHRY
jgi:alpha-galactosidase